MDPFTFQDDDFSFEMEAVPEVTLMDIVAYLVLTHSFYTNDQMRAYKSLEAYKYFEAGFVEKVGCKSFPNNFTVMVGQVRTDYGLLTTAIYA